VIVEPPSAPAENVRVTVLAVGVPDTATDVGAPVGTVVATLAHAEPLQYIKVLVSVKNANCPVNGLGITVDLFAVVVTVIPLKPEPNFA